MIFTHMDRCLVAGCGLISEPTVQRLSGSKDKSLRLFHFFLDKLLYLLIIIPGSDQHHVGRFKFLVDRALWRLARQMFAEVSRETIDGAVLNLLFWQRLILYSGVTIREKTGVYPRQGQCRVYQERQSRSCFIVIQPFNPLTILPQERR